MYYFKYTYLTLKKYLLKNIIIGNLFYCRKNSTTLEKFHLQISRLELYSEDSKYVDQLLYEMATKPILHVGK